MPEAEILIIGGGPAGLTTAGALKQAGIDATILDRGEYIGQSWEQRYDRLHLHTMRTHSGLAHFPIPRSYPRYLSKDQYAAYLREYAAHFGLNVIARTSVQRVRQEQYNGQAGWAAEAGLATWRSRVVVIATGQYGQSMIPEWAGCSQFRGKLLHSSQYHSGREFQGQRVLVIGCGNSGLEIAVDLVEQRAARVAISIRSGPPVVPRDFLGVSIQAYAILLNSLPPFFSDFVGKAVSWLAWGDLERYGFPAPAWGPFRAQRVPVIDVGFTAALKAGKFDIRPDIACFTPGGVVFSDLHEEAFDVAVLATGFRAGLEQLLEPAGLLDKDGNPCFPSGTPTAYPGLFFMGYFESLRGFLFESNLASQRLAKEIKAYL